MKPVQPILAAAGLAVLGACSGPSSAPQAPHTDVVLATERGEIVIRLDREAAPQSSAAFLSWVEEGRYIPRTSGFYRIVSHANDNGTPLINIVQGGLIDVPESVEGVVHESSEQTGLPNIAGSVALARGEIDTASPAYFFVNVTDNPGLDHGQLRNPDGQGFAVFGHVVEGMDIILAIHDTPASAQAEDAYMAGQMLADPVRFTASLRE